MNKTQVKNFYWKRVVTMFGGWLLLIICAVGGVQAADEKMSFFITSVGLGDGANFGGLSGADGHCKNLAEEAGITGKVWHAYLSTSAPGAVNARDRIGTGPWFNSKGILVASSVDDLHSQANKLNKENSLSEKGGVVNGRGDKPNMHDILTGSHQDGTAFEDEDLSCGNWTRSDADGHAQLGHHDRTGGGAHPKSWNSAHASRGCSQENLIRTGGNGFFYCFAEH